jgi:hypothetical protein
VRAEESASAPIVNELDICREQGRTTESAQPPGPEATLAGGADRINLENDRGSPHLRLQPDDDLGRVAFRGKTG